MTDFFYKGTLGGVSPETKTVKVAAGAVASIAIGKIVQCDNGYAALPANGGVSAAGRFGLTTSTSTDTVAADGTVEVLFCPTGLLIQGKATTPANLATALIFDRVTLDVSGGGVQTVDENDPNGVLTIFSYDNTTDGNTIVSLPWLV